MDQNDYLTLSEDGKTVISCRKDYAGAIVIPEGVTEIGPHAFEGCTSLVELHLRHKEPIDLSGSLNVLDPSKITLYVPEGTEDTYRHHPFFSKFKEVVIER